MALTSDGWKLYVTLIDSGGDTAKLTYDLVAANQADAVTATTAILSRLNNVTDATVKSYFLGERFVEDALTTFPLGAEVERHATITCQIANNPLKKHTLKIPAPVAAMFGAEGTTQWNVVTITNAALALYVSIFETGGFAKISDGEFLETGSIRSGKRTGRQSSFG